MSFNKIRKETEKNLEEAHKLRLERCVPVAREIIKLFASKADTVAMGEVEQNHVDFQDLAVEIMKLMLEKDVRWVDREFVFQLALQPMTFSQNIATTSLNNSWNTALTGLFGKKSSELTFKELDILLKKGDAIEGEVKTA